jgi:hypothetical protein
MAESIRRTALNIGFPLYLLFTVAWRRRSWPVRLASVFVLLVTGSCGVTAGLNLSALLT